MTKFQSYLLLFAIAAAPTFVAGKYIFENVSTTGKIYKPPCLNEADLWNGGISCPVAVHTAAAADKTFNILFIGNSFTFMNDLGGMLAKVASSDPTNKIQMNIQSVTLSGAHLMGTYKDPEALKVLHTRHWDFVVLQEHSAWTFTQESVEETFDALNSWNWEIRKIPATPVFFENWSDEIGSGQYTDTHYHLYGQNPDQVQKEFSRETYTLAKSYDMPVVPVGDFWNYVNKKPRAPELYNVDKHHPSPAGTYLTALLFYRYFTSHAPDHVAFWPPEITPEQAQMLIAAIPR